MFYHCKEEKAKTGPEIEKNRKRELDSFPSEPNMQQECEGVGLAHSVGLGHSSTEAKLSLTSG